MGLPKRWLPYTKFGEQIPGTRFVALKCPLRPTLCTALPEEQQFTPRLLMQYLPSIKMIIDLTFTTKYYKPEEFKSAGLRHVKVFCKGHEIPDTKVIHTFFNEVDLFLEKETEGLIGVHCTHGVNRTGFLICKYMIAKLGFQPQDAIIAFGKARGHLIERTNYISGLGVPHAEVEKLVGQEPEDEKVKQSPPRRTGNRNNRSNNNDDRWSSSRHQRDHQGRWDRMGPNSQGPRQYHHHQPRHYNGHQQWRYTPQDQYYNQGYNSWRPDYGRNSRPPHVSWHQHQGASYRSRDNGQNWRPYYYDRGNGRNYNEDSRSSVNGSKWNDRRMEQNVQPARPDLIEVVPTPED